MTAFTKITYRGGPVGDYDGRAVEQFLDRLRASGFDPRVIEHPSWPLVVVVPGGTCAPLEMLASAGLCPATQAEVQKWLLAGTFEERLEITVQGSPLAIAVLQSVLLEQGLESARGSGNRMTITVMPGNEKRVRDLVGVVRVEIVNERVVSREGVPLSVPA